MVPARAAASPKPPDIQAFRGWPLEVVEFFDALEMDNSKSYWTGHKEFYEDSVVGPMQALLAELAAEFGGGRVFRPYRDTRFSRDKSPYKTNIAAHNGAGYISLSADALGVGSGLYMPAPDQLARFRAAVAADKSGAELLSLVSGLRQKRIQVTAHETLKSAPRGYAADHPRIDLLRHKGLTAWREWPVGAWLATAASKRRIVDVLRATAPLRKWLDSNVGAADGP
ncbi:MAG TPA: DUF2461 domain-containing protein [Acidimicrobiales bacterium]